MPKYLVFATFVFLASQVTSAQNRIPSANETECNSTVVLDEIVERLHCSTSPSIFACGTGNQTARSGAGAGIATAGAGVAGISVQTRAAAQYGLQEYRKSFSTVLRPKRDDLARSIAEATHDAWRFERKIDDIAEYERQLIRQIDDAAENYRVVKARTDIAIKAVYPNAMEAEAEQLGAKNAETALRQKLRALNPLKVAPKGTPIFQPNVVEIERAFIDTANTKFSDLPWDMKRKLTTDAVDAADDAIRVLASGRSVGHSVANAIRGVRITAAEHARAFGIALRTGARVIPIVGAVVLALEVAAASETSACAATLIADYVNRGPDCLPTFEIDTAKVLPFLLATDEERIKALRTVPDLCDHYKKMLNNLKNPPEGPKPLSAKCSAGDVEMEVETTRMGRYTIKTSTSSSYISKIDYTYRFHNSNTTSSANFTTQGRPIDFKLSPSGGSIPWNRLAARNSSHVQMQEFVERDTRHLTANLEAAKLCCKRGATETCLKEALSGPSAQAPAPVSSGDR